MMAVDWERGLDTNDYTQAVANARVVKSLIAQILTSLRHITNANYSSMHLIGHSLGLIWLAMLARVSKTLEELQVGFVYW